MSLSSTLFLLPSSTSTTSPRPSCDFKKSASRTSSCNSSNANTEYLPALNTYYRHIRDRLTLIINHLSRDASAVSAHDHVQVRFGRDRETGIGNVATIEADRFCEVVRQFIWVASHIKLVIT